MTLRDRVAKAVDGFFSSSKVVQLIAEWRYGQPSYSEINFSNVVKHGWRRNELIFACINKTANTAAQVELVVKDSSGKVIEDHPLKTLLHHPNDFMNEFDFWAAIIIYHKLAGRAYFEKERNNAGQVIKLWPLRPDWVSVIPGAKTPIAAYKYEVPGAGAVLLDPKDVLDFKLYDPLGLYDTWAPVAVASRSGDIDNATTDYLKMFFEKGGTPPGILKSTQRLKDAQVADIRRRWRERYGGSENWLDPAVLDSNAEYQRIGLSFREMGFEVLDSRSEARICMTMDVPPILVGAKVGLDRATYSNYGEARKAWWEDTLVPLYVNLGDTIENGLLTEFQGAVEIEWDFSRVPALQEERNGRWERATRAAVAGLITLNMFYEEISLPNIGPAGDVYIRNPAFMEVPAKTVKVKNTCPYCGTATLHVDKDGRCDQCGGRLEVKVYEQPQTVYFGGNGHHHDHEEKTVPVGEMRFFMEDSLTTDITKYFDGLKERIKERA
jgi:HK97 family phage portal protein